MTPMSAMTGFNSSTATTTPNPEAATAYSDLLRRSRAVADTPYQPYTGQLVQGFSPDQMQAFQQVRQMQGIANPYISGATGATYGAMNLANPSNFNQDAVNRYYSPYQNDVINATMAQLQNQNAQQQNQVVGNAIAQGAMGGDRVAVAQAQLAGQQALANNQTLAQLENQGYSQALGEYNQQQQTGIGALQAGAYGLGQLGTEAQNAALQGSQALLGTGGLQQQLGQAGLSTNYQQFLNALAFPYQQASWLSGIVNQTGPNMGGTTSQSGYSNQQQQQANPSTLGQIAGLGMAGLGMIPYSGWQSLGSGISSGLGALAPMMAFASNGGRIERDSGGAIPASLSHELSEDRWKSHDQSTSADAPMAFADGGRVYKDGGGSLGSLASLPSSMGPLGATNDLPYGGGSPIIPQGLLQSHGGGHWQAPQVQPIHEMPLPQIKAPTGLLDSVTSGIGALNDKQKQGFGGFMKGLIGDNNQPIQLPKAGFSPQDIAVANAQTSGVYARGGGIREGFADGGDAPVDLPPIDVASSQISSDAIEALKSAIAKRETGGHDDPYSVIGPESRKGDRPYGKYQVMGENVPQWTREALGKEMSPQDFLADKDAQERVASHKLGQYYSNTGSPAEAAKMWIGGPNYNPNAHDVLGTTPGAYANDVVRSMGQKGGLSPDLLAYAQDTTGASNLGGLKTASDAPTVGSTANEKSFLDFSPETRQGLIAAGLGMMASRSPWAGVAIGEGGLKGMEIYQHAVDLARQQQLTGAQVANLKSEIAMRPQDLSLRQRLADIQEQQFMRQNQLTQVQLGLEAAKTQALSAGLRDTRYVPGVGWLMFDKAHPEKGWQSISGPTQSAQSPAAPAHALISSQPTNDQVKTPSPASTPVAPSAPAPTSHTRGSENIINWTPTTDVGNGPLSKEQTDRQMAISSNPEQQKIEAELAKKQLEESRDKASNADTALYRLDEMDHQFEKLPQRGSLAPGSFANARMSFAKNVNQVLNTMGYQPFDADQIAAMESLSKDTFRLGADLSRQIGGREPGFIVQSAVSANPGIENTVMGYRRIVAGLREAQRFEQDKSAFRDSWFTRFGNLNGADEEFRKINNPEQYVKRAVLSTVSAKDTDALRSADKAHLSAVESAIDKKYGKGTAKMIMGETQ